MERGAPPAEALLMASGCTSADALRAFLRRLPTPRPQEDTMPPHTLHRCLTGEPLRPATFLERCHSREAHRLNGIAGVILVDGISCYVEDGSGYADPACEEQAWEAYDDACASWGETAAEVGASHFVSTRNAVDANLVGQQAAGRIPQPEDYGVTPSAPAPPPPPPIDHDEIPF